MIDEYLSFFDKKETMEVKHNSNSGMLMFVDPEMEELTKDGFYSAALGSRLAISPDGKLLAVVKEGAAWVIFDHWPRPLSLKSIFEVRVGTTRSLP